jgi:hypothetical protein
MIDLELLCQLQDIQHNNVAIYFTWSVIALREGKDLSV